MKNYFTYETKCRRCNHVSEWTVHKSLNKENFNLAMIDKIKIPIQMICVKCKKPTVQDLVSFNDQID